MANAAQTDTRKEAEMPGGDKTGPAGAGPRTGRSLGYCAGYDRPGYAQGGGFGGGFGRGRGFGRGMGLGRGFSFGRGYGRAYFEEVPQQIAPAEQSSAQQGEIRSFDKRLSRLEEKLDELLQRGRE